MRVYIVRHGSTEWNLTGKWQGSSDVPLSAIGIRDATLTANFLADKVESIEAIYSSDLSRAAETAEIIGERFGKPPIKMKELRECRMDLWSGLKIEEILEKYGKEFQEWRTNPDAEIPDTESLNQVQKRAVRAFKTITSSLSDESNIIIVSHALWIRLLLCRVLNIPIQQHRKFNLWNCSVTILDYDSRFGWVVDTLNYYFHLEVDTKKAIENR
ncbi:MULTISPECIES: histidine phosphatase family protein [Kosmotoga]|jgi:probable phosphoglycerate mutase|uniref:Phosphoglycerate mutase n=1 Tax=Kosmotoga olearia (strain ATCC BAA-1733 / DSM 21960 / TBF 19.5.1) TaxID=521045 RepID=C5CGU3_KOSOT|nr:MULTISPECIES: histidine phosphatase family protein [Kosmotoga]ACR80612.1 Phosphoglycerate mutase [Kosmotoga olearia TBF 19.5.1]MDI3523258.1 hypothetical protein [Kosmotoga sp.]MDK2952813.1 hypothetical protein [Kosmotoga sp.]OAA19478.1 hypothetical protein DU53_10535 [Kosmotoga sp. DU53]